jgi:hypothetical protein
MDWYTKGHGGDLPICNIIPKRQSSSNFLLIFVCAVKLPNNTPSGTITTHLPPLEEFWRIYNTKTLRMIGLTRKLDELADAISDE